MIRILKVVLLLAIVVPFAWIVRSEVRGLSDYWLDMSVAVFVGFALCFALWRWDERIRQRDGRGS